ncbi:exo-beta-N-acetylmuramidase NamZ domain-containing protein [Camelliibacillus cellulosilyticus]|uniref:Exo-beta-N-acetylmuramidase NamZ domain-containing protein n=1 Tax=Camelliibacillus cellulosilyticus TaxID=2174486 RepID=A0ABV9GQK9_9BACL
MVELGVDQFLKQEVERFKGKRIGLVTNMTGVSARLEPTIDLFHVHPDIELVALYGPEHGIRGDAKEGEKVASGQDPYTGLPVYSLYGETRKPTKAMLEAIDTIVIDLQDIGTRYYTFIYTVANVMEACMEENKEVVVLDRPNPINGVRREGNLVREDFRSFVGLYPLPVRHGLTIGEIALLYKHEFGLDCDLTVIRMDGWSREMFFDDTGLLWVPASPNSTGQAMSILYPGTCLIEGTNLSEGRGTTRPFEVIGAPFVDGYRLAKRVNEKGLEGIIARPTSFIPTYQKHKDVLCSGIQLHVTDKSKVDSFKTGLYLLEAIAELFPNDLEFRDADKKRSFFNLLAGTDELKDVILAQKADHFLEKCEVEIERFTKVTKPYLLY